MLDKEVIRPSTSPWSSPVVLVPKKNGNIRFCVDYWKINKITIKDSYPLPRIDDTLQMLRGANTFTSLDLKAGYWQIPIQEDHYEKMAFITHDGLYQFISMPFGLCNAPATFQRLMSSILKQVKKLGVMVYLDDIIIYSNNPNSYLQTIEEVLKILQKHHLILNLKKCTFMCNEILYLGHLISFNTIKINAKKTSAIENI